VSFYFVQKFFKCSFDHAKRAFCRSLNAILGRLVSEEVLLQLVNIGKCLPVLLYGAEACAVNKSDIFIGGFGGGVWGSKPPKFFDIAKTAAAPTLNLFYNYNPLS
jgi:hypothetical protein